MRNNSKLCRVCLTKGSIYIYGQSSVENLVLVSSLNIIGGIQISTADPYPKYLCESCHASLQNAALFRKTAQESDSLLREAINTPKCVETYDRSTKNKDIVRSLHESHMPDREITKTINIESDNQSSKSKSDMEDDEAVPGLYESEISCRETIKTIALKSDDQSLSESEIENDNTVPGLHKSDILHRETTKTTPLESDDQSSESESEMENDDTVPGIHKSDMPHRETTKTILIESDNQSSESDDQSTESESEMENDDTIPGLHESDIPDRETTKTIPIESDDQSHESKSDMEYNDPVPGLHGSEIPRRETTKTTPLESDDQSSESESEMENDDTVPGVHKSDMPHREKTKTILIESDNQSSESDDQSSESESEMENDDTIPGLHESDIPHRETTKTILIESDAQSSESDLEMENDEKVQGLQESDVLRKAIDATPIESNDQIKKKSDNDDKVSGLQKSNVHVTKKLNGEACENDTDMKNDNKGPGLHDKYSQYRSLQEYIDYSIPKLLNMPISISRHLVEQTVAKAESSKKTDNGALKLVNKPSGFMQEHVKVTKIINYYNIPKFTNKATGAKLQNKEIETNKKHIKVTKIKNYTTPQHNQQMETNKGPEKVTKIMTYAIPQLNKQTKTNEEPVKVTKIINYTTPQHSQEMETNKGPEKVKKIMTYNAPQHNKRSKTNEEPVKVTKIINYTTPQNNKQNMETNEGPVSTIMTYTTPQHNKQTETKQEVKTLYSPSKPTEAKKTIDCNTPMPHNTIETGQESVKLKRVKIKKNGVLTTIGFPIYSFLKKQIKDNHGVKPGPINIHSEEILFVCSGSHNGQEKGVATVTYPVYNIIKKQKKDHLSVGLDPNNANQLNLHNDGQTSTNACQNVPLSVDIGPANAYQEIANTSLSASPRKEIRGIWRIRRTDFKCDECDTQYNLLDYLDHYKSKHPEQKKVKCPTCQKKYSITYFEKHMYDHKVGACVCEICGKSILSWNSFLLHRATHTKKLPFKCSLCPYRGRFKSSVKSHMKSHGEKLYMCQHCPRRFISKSNLCRHMARHNGELRFECETCKYKFYAKGELKNHIKSVHLGLKEHICKLCDCAFTSASVLNAHQIRVHGRTKLPHHGVPLYIRFARENDVEVQSIAS